MKKYFLIILSIIFFSVLAPNSAFAAETVIAFDSTINIEQSGNFNVTETIKYDFGISGKHGIFREIPLTRQLGNVYQTITITPLSVLRDGLEEKYSTSLTSSSIQLKVGDPSKTINGAHTYTIAYRVQNGFTNYQDHDELSWNVTGTDWEAPINSATATLVTPLNITVTKAACYTGAQGSHDQGCSITSENKLFATSKGLSPKENLTIVAAFPKDSFPKSTLTTSKPRANFSPQAALALLLLYLIPLIILNIILPLGVYFWYRTHHKKSDLGPVKVNFNIPYDKDGDRISPAEAGAIDTAKLDQNDVIATIFDLAIRKFIKLKQEVETSSFLGFDTSKKEYTIEKLMPPENDIPLEHEQILMKRLFRDGDTVQLSDLNDDFYKTFKEMQDAIFTQLVKRGYYAKNPTDQRNMFYAFSFIALFFGGPILAITLFLLARVLTSRTKTGDIVDWNIDGLKEFLSKMTRNYKWQADQLAVVEQMIPYAMALGYINQFMEQLQIIQPDYNPTWYSGNTPFYHVAPLMISSMNSNMTTSAPSSSSGFSGGGFSGGGGGGGGGGSW